LFEFDLRQAPFTNFTSFSLLDNNDKKSKFKISLIDFSGKELANKKISLSKFTSKAIDVKELFNEIITPEYGLITVKYISPIHFLNKMRILGDALSSHFYCLYHSPDNKSLALIHPQQYITKQKYKNTKPYFWMSQYVFDTKNVKEMHIYQLNVLESWNVETGCAVLDAKDDQIILENKYHLAAKSANKTVFDITKIRDNHKNIKISLKALCGDNAKPLVFIYFNDGTFTGTHA